MANQVVIRSKQDVFNLVNSGAIVTHRSWMIILIALGGTFIDAYDFTSLGIGAVQLKAQFHLNAVQLGSLTATMAFGALIAAFIGGYYVDRVGRLKMFMLDLVFFVVSAIAAAFAPDLLVLLIFRFFMGVGVGLDFPAALSFVAEYTGTQRKGRSVQMWQVMWYTAAATGFIIIIPIYFLGAGADLWRWAVGIGAVPAVIVLALRYRYMDESPMWAASKGDLPGAARVLREAYGVDAVVADGAERQTVRAQMTSLKEYAQLFSRHYRARTTLAAVIGFTQSMEYFAVGFYLPTISLLIFGKKFLFAILGSAVFNLFGILGGGINVKVTQKVGIRKLAIIGYLGVLVALLAIGLLGHVLPALVMGLFVALFITAHAMGQGSTGMSMGALSYPTAIRGVGAGFTQGVIRVGSIFGFYFFPIVLAIFGLEHTLLLIGMVPLIGLLVTLAIHWDPTGKDIDQEETDLDAALAATSGQ